MISDKTLEKRLNVIRRNWTCCAAIMYGHSIQYLAGIYGMPAQTLKNCIVHCIRFELLVVHKGVSPSPVAIIDSLREQRGKDRRTMLTIFKKRCGYMMETLKMRKIVLSNGFRRIKSCDSYVIDSWPQRFFSLAAAYDYLCTNHKEVEYSLKSCSESLDSWFIDNIGEVDEKAFD